MPNNFEIRIFGVCLCFYKAPYWDVIFPCDEHHAALACINKVPEILRHDERVMLIEIAPDATAPIGPYMDTTVVPPFNMSANYAHGSPSMSNLELKDITLARDPKTMKPLPFVRLRVPNATLYSERPTACEYYVQDVTSAVGLPVQLIGQVAREVVLRFNQTRDISLTSVDIKNSGYSVNVGPALPIPAGGDMHLIEIDNDCHSATSLAANDFLNLYRIVSDVGNPHTQYAAGQIKCSAGPEDSITLDCFPTEDFETEMGIVIPQYGNCDPVVSDPPPG